MRALLIVIALVLVFAFLGWITFSKSPDHTSVNLETDKIRSDTTNAMQSGAEMLHRAGDKVDSTRAPSNPPAETAVNNR